MSLPLDPEGIVIFALVFTSLGCAQSLVPSPAFPSKSEFLVGLLLVSPWVKHRR